MNNGVNYIIISRPSYITFKCPFCHEEVEVNFEEVDFNTDYWGDGAWCDCPECGEEVELDDYEYDQENKNMAIGDGRKTYSDSTLKSMKKDERLILFAAQKVILEMLMRQMIFNMRTVRGY